jgi:hypothetical protein
MKASKEKAPRPDGFIGLFFSTCWETIKGDILKAVDHFYMMNQQGLHFLNQDFVVLIPKKYNPLKISEYRPISLSHSFVKTISKILANRLGPELDHLISFNQTAFIKKSVFMIILSMCTKLSRIFTKERYLPYLLSFTFPRLLIL